jgi:hypothetical protein
MEDGVPTSSTVEATDLLHPDLISTASLTPQTMTAIGKATGKATSNATGGKIPTASYAKHSAIQPLTTLNSSIGAMDNSLVQI